ncbi:hypothetical protein [Bacillus piscicola]|uniref:hypothetical protein n=1 Tax=Bacillus piscicola TaxID=1632684 RepID=UPI001F08B1A1|nr:hypothetical protein [Bacillus piscicola]
MKKLLLFLLFILIAVSAYYDVTTGTLMTTSLENETGSAPPPSFDGVQRVEVTVEPGQTVLTIVEKLHNGPVPASINQITQDFKKLNNGLLPENIQVDKPYVFPIYEKEPDI